MLGITELTYTALISFLIVVILGPIFIPMLTKFKFGQTVRDDGPKTHLAKKSLTFRKLRSWHPVPSLHGK